jgi:cell division cycle 20-like protein 1 (cofactor of APC complex)
MGHDARVGALAWSQNMLTSGGRDRFILLRDLRSPDPYVKRLASHRQEVRL